MRKPFRKSVKKDLSLSKESQIDIWLSRLSHLSQIGLLAVAVFGYFYTVMPVYQKSLLDEQIAQKELELKASKKAIEESYKQIRKDMVGSYLHYASVACTGLLEKPQAPLQLGEKPLPPLKRNGKVFEIDVSNCMNTKLNASKKLLKTLRGNDLVFLSKKIETIGKEIEVIRLDAKKNFNEFPDKAISNPDLLKPIEVESFAYVGLLALKDRVSPENYQAYLFSAQLDQELSKLANEYRNTVMHKISEVADIEWPQSNLSVQLNNQN